MRSTPPNLYLFKMSTIEKGGMEIVFGFFFHSKKEKC